jgi:hypothetical protein
MSKDEVIGVMNVHARKGVSFPNRRQACSSPFPSISAATENAIIYEEVKRKAKQLDLLSEISRTIVSDYYLKEILQLIVTMTAQVMGPKICSIMLLDDKKQELVIAATQSLSQAITKQNLKVGQSISRQGRHGKAPHHRA